MGKLSTASGRMRWMRLRGVALPAWYAAVLAGLLLAGALRAQWPVASAVIWLTTALCSMVSLLLLELLGARAFAGRGVEGSFLERQASIVFEYSAAQRAWYLAHAMGCWVLVGLLSVLGFRALGEHLAFAAAAPIHAGVRELPALVQVGLAFLLLDGWSYLRHRAEHAGAESGLLWRAVHRYHHTSTHLSVWAGMLVHPLEAVFVVAVPMTLLGALGVAPWEVLMAFSGFMLVVMPQHMNSGWTIGRLACVIHGPEAHTRHHSIDFDTRNMNFADCLTLWDRLGGTWAPASPSLFTGPFGIACALPVTAERGAVAR